VPFWLQSLSMVATTLPLAESYVVKVSWGLPQGDCAMMGNLA
jgi:hypothetical protein